MTYTLEYGSHLQNQVVCQSPNLLDLLRQSIIYIVILKFILECTKALGTIQEQDQIVK